MQYSRPSADAATTLRDLSTAALLREQNAEGIQRLLEDYGGIVRERLRKRFHRVLDDSELDEALSLGAIKVWRAATNYDGTKGSLRAWFSTIAHNCALRLLANRKRSPVTSVTDLDRIAPAPSEPTAATLQRQRLLLDTAHCLRRLPKLQRAILEADLEAGGRAPAAELAQQLRTSPNSIYVSRLKGLRGLRAMLAALGHFAPGAAPTHQEGPTLQAESG